MATKTDTDALRDDIAALKRDLAALTESLKHGDLREKIDGALGGFSEEAAKVYDDWSRRSRESFETVTHSVEERPFLWIAVAFLLGFVGSRLTERR